DGPVPGAHDTGGVQHLAVPVRRVPGRQTGWDHDAGPGGRRRVDAVLRRRGELVPALLDRPRPAERARDAEGLVVAVGAAAGGLAQVAQDVVAYRCRRVVQQVPVDAHQVTGADRGRAPAGVFGWGWLGVLEAE